MPKSFEKGLLAGWLATDEQDATLSTLEAISGPGWTRTNDPRKIVPGSFPLRRIACMPVGRPKAAKLREPAPKRRI
jgi:hypothetical protein